MTLWLGAGLKVSRIEGRPRGEKAATVSVLVMAEAKVRVLFLGSHVRSLYV